MLLEGEGKPIPTRDWLATEATTIKASTALAHTLPPEDRLLVIQGAHLHANLLGEDNYYWMISGAVLNGVALPESFRFIYKRHWQPKPEDVLTSEHSPIPVVADEALPEPPPLATETARVAPPQEPTPIAAKEVPDAKAEPAPETTTNPPSQRRLFASFRRRLTHR